MSLPTFVTQTLRNSASASAEDWQKASVQAQKAGYPKLAEALKKRSMTSSIPEHIKSPWPDVSDAAWTHFVSAIAKGMKPNSVNPRGFYGLFQFSVRRLCDLGVMASPKAKNVQVPGKGAVRIWNGEWKIAEKAFLTDPRLQYDLFVRSMELYRNIIMEKYQQVLGLDVDGGRKATLSGLLALAHTAGIKGMHKWLSNRRVREKFPWVTKAFQRANGIF